MITFFSEPETVAILELKGEIGKSLSFQTAKEMIDQAFGIKNLQAVLLEISSPGGSSFETEQIAEYLKAMMTRTNIPIVSFVMDQALSGGYWLACSGLEIYATGRLSMVGSIGVIMEYHNYDNLVEELGVEKRTITSGEMKDLMNSEEGEGRLKAVAQEIHQIFIDSVQASRGDKLNRTEDIFNGDLWLAEEALRLGLVDGIQTSLDYIGQNFTQETAITRIKIQKMDFANILKNMI